MDVLPEFYGTSVVVETPFAPCDEEIRLVSQSGNGWTENDSRLAIEARNKKYLHACLLDCMRNGEAPYASHLFFTQFLDDTQPSERTAGMNAGMVWGEKASKCVIYGDCGITEGMRKGAAHYKTLGLIVEYRYLYGDMSHVEASI